MTTAVALTVQKTETIFNLLDFIFVSKIFAKLNFHQSKAFQVLLKKDIFLLRYNSTTLEQCSQY